MVSVTEGCILAELLVATAVLDAPAPHPAIPRATSAVPTPQSLLRTTSVNHRQRPGGKHLGTPPVDALVDGLEWMHPSGTWRYPLRPHPIMSGQGSKDLPRTKEGQREGHAASPSH